MFLTQAQPSVQASRIMLLCSYKKEEYGRDPEETKLEISNVFGGMGSGSKDRKQEDHIFNLRKGK